MAKAYRTIAATLAVLLVRGVVAYGQLAHEVQIQVTVLDPSGEPIPDLAVSALSRMSAVSAVTDASGDVTLTIQTPDIVTSVYVGPTSESTASTTLSDDELLQNYDQATTDFSLPRDTAIAIAPGTDIYSVVINAKPAVSISGSVVRPDGSPISAAACNYIGSPRFEVMDPDTGSFSLGGVPRGEDGVLVFNVYRDPRQYVIPMTAVDTAADRDIGAITIPDPVADAPIEVTIQERTAAFTTIDPTVRYIVSLISEDGLTIYKFKIAEDLKLHNRNPHDEISVMGGSYFVVPGSISNQHLGAVVLQALLAGDIASVQAAGVPSILAVAGQSQAFNVDLLAAEAAVLSMP